MTSGLLEEEVLPRPIPLVRSTTSTATLGTQVMGENKYERMPISGTTTTKPRCPNSGKTNDTMVADEDRYSHQ